MKAITNLRGANSRAIHTLLQKASLVLLGFYGGENVHHNSQVYYFNHGATENSAENAATSKKNSDFFDDSVTIRCDAIDIPYGPHQEYQTQAYVALYQLAYTPLMKPSNVMHLDDEYCAKLEHFVQAKSLTNSDIMMLFIIDHKRMHTK